MFTGTELGTEIALGNRPSTGILGLGCSPCHRGRGDEQPASPGIMFIQIGVAQWRAVEGRWLGRQFAAATGLSDDNVDEKVMAFGGFSPDSSRAVVLNGWQFGPPRNLWHCLETVWWSQLGGGGDSWYRWVGARDAVNSPTMQRTGPHHKRLSDRKCPQWWGWEMLPIEEWKADRTENMSRNQKA